MPTGPDRATAIRETMRASPDVPGPGTCLDREASHGNAEGEADDEAEASDGEAGRPPAARGAGGCEASAPEDDRVAAGSREGGRAGQAARRAPGGRP